MQWRLKPNSSYQAQKEHAEELDLRLGFDIEATERQIREKYKNPDGQEFWLKLPAQTLQTPYTELADIVHELKPSSGDLWIDLGAGYGRLGLVLSQFASGVRFIGFEVIQERVEAGNRILQKWSRDSNLVLADISESTFRPPIAHVYFLYDFGSRPAISKITEDLKAIAQTQAICVVGRGRAVRDHIEQNTPWLSQVIAPTHHERYSIYRSSEVPECLNV